MSNSLYTANRGCFMFNNPIELCECACSGAEVERSGPYGEYLDLYFDTDDLDTGSFERAEAESIRLTVNALMKKAKINEKNIDVIIGGDLLNQNTASAYGLEGFDVPYIGMYGACSTFALGVLTAGMLIDSGHINTAIVVASSHFCSAERQFRYPLEYGSITSTTAQTTVTGVGAVYISRATENKPGVMLTGGTYGIVCNNGIKDASNMGAAMATAAADTICRYLNATGKNITAFDKLATGDLGAEGLEILKELLSKKQIDGGETLCDCGEMIYDRDSQNVGCGGSGCGCSGVMTSGFFFNQLKQSKIKRFALVGTGALMSPQSLLQGQSIPSVAHMITIEKR